MSLTVSEPCCAISGGRMAAALVSGVGMGGGKMGGGDKTGGFGVVGFDSLDHWIPGSGTLCCS